MDDGEHPLSVAARYKAALAMPKLPGRALASLEQRLDPRRFFRANRRQIINLDFIAAWSSGSADVCTCS